MPTPESISFAEIAARMQEIERQRNNALAELAIMAGREVMAQARIQELETKLADLAKKAEECVCR